MSLETTYFDTEALIYSPSTHCYSMMWQDLVFMIGSGLSIGFLVPTLRDANARVPIGTSLPSMALGIVYGLTFATLGMTFSALGAFAAGLMWSLIAVARSPTSFGPDRYAIARLVATAKPTRGRVHAVSDRFWTFGNRCRTFGNTLLCVLDAAKANPAWSEVDDDHGYDSESTADHSGYSAD